VWGKLPPKERVKAMLEDAKEIKDPRYRKLVEDYAKELAKQIDNGTAK
jgi:acyl-CoA hydrolase